VFVTGAAACDTVGVGDLVMIVRRILVPLDFSEHSLRALRVAIDLAKQTGASLRLLAVLEMSDIRLALQAGLYGFSRDSDLHAAVSRWVQRRFASLELPPGVRATKTVRRGLIEEEIVAAAGRGVQLIVMGSSGVISRFPVGSKTKAVLRNSPVPVLVVPATAREEKGRRSG
jgi:nucleotide-binding universal stress UspA family protein